MAEKLVTTDFYENCKKKSINLQYKIQFSKIEKKNQKLLIFSDLSIDFQQVFHSKF
jgi:hypothetical protein